MKENMPRRLARFYREQNNQNYNYDYNKQPQPQNTNQRHSRENNEEDYYLIQSNQIQKDQLPTMDYEDVNLELDKKNREEIQKIREKNLVEKLALEEIEKFKIQNKRMPNQKEEEQIAENLFKQLKETPPEEGSKRYSRQNRNNKQNLKESIGIPGEELKEMESIKEGENNDEHNTVKDLFAEDNFKSKKRKENDEFDLGMGDLSETSENKLDNTDDLDSISEFNLEDESICPNCQKSTEKIIYCSKCGTAFCSNCVKMIENEKTCPKCKTKVKI